MDAIFEFFEIFAVICFVLLQIKKAKRSADKHLAMYAEGYLFVFSSHFCDSLVRVL